MTIAVKKDDIKIEYSRDPSHGDFASNLAMVLAKTCNCNPRELANRILEYLPKSDLIIHDIAIVISGRARIRCLIMPEFCFF